MADFHEPKGWRSKVSSHFEKWPILGRIAILERDEVDGGSV